MLSMTRNEAIPYDAMKAGMPWDWVTFPDFIESLIRTPKGVNCLTYVPLTPLYAWVMGWEEAKKRRPTEAELAGNVPADPRGDGCRRVRLVSPGLGREINPAGL